MYRNPFLKTPKIRLTRKAFAKTNEGPAVYCFIKDNRPIYIGKAVNLRSRLKSYLTNDLEPKTKTMVTSADFVSYIKVASDLEALLLEAEFIRKYKPLYNVISKDDKHALYIRFTKEKYPRILTCRKIDTDKDDTLTFFGPFPSSTNVRDVLRMLRRVFPYSDHKLGKKPCLLYQLGLCYPCPNLIEAISSKKEKEILHKKYRSNISMIVKILQRKSGQVKNALIKRMADLSKGEKYEEAQDAREQLKKLEYISQNITKSESYLHNPNLLEDIHQKEIKDLIKFIYKKSKLKVKAERIECFDIAHLSGVSPAASMVTFIGGEESKEYYRHIKIRYARSADDLGAMKEVAGMRLRHLKDWGIPDLIIVDGGKGQVNVFEGIFSKFNILVVGLAKRFESLVIPSNNQIKGKYIMVRLPQGPALNLLQRIRNEAHRFARRYHHLLLKRELLS